MIKTELENITIINADCQDVELGQFDVVFTDPPYVLTQGGEGSGTGMRGKMLTMRAENKGEIVPCDISWEQIATVVERITAPQSKAFVMCNDKHIANCLQAFSQFNYHGLFQWIKPNATFTQFGMKDCEYMALFYKGKAQQFFDMGIKRTLMGYDNPKSEHPTPKPPKMIYDILKACGAKSVCDPFAGSGSTGIACAMLGIPCVLVEKDPEYYELCVENVRKAVMVQPSAETGLLL